MGERYYLRRWCGGVDVQMPRDTMVQVWMGDALDVERVMRAGQRVIFSSCWYLDYVNYGMDWDKYYMCEQLSTYALARHCLSAHVL